jgi:hypothetical protein
MEEERERYDRVVWHLGGKFPIIIEVESSYDRGFGK